MQAVTKGLKVRRDEVRERFGSILLDILAPNGLDLNLWTRRCFTTVFFGILVWFGHPSVVCEALHLTGDETVYLSHIHIQSSILDALHSPHNDLLPGATSKVFADPPSEFTWHENERMRLNPCTSVTDEQCRPPPRVWDWRLGRCYRIIIVWISLSVSHRLSMFPRPSLTDANQPCNKGIRTRSDPVVSSGRTMQGCIKKCPLKIFCRV